MTSDELLNASRVSDRKHLIDLGGRLYEQEHGPFSKIIDQVLTDQYGLYHGDCVKVAQGLPDDSIHFSVSSWPFCSLYSYTDALEDMSNIETHEQFFAGIDYLLEEMARIMMPGRLVATHCMNLPKTIERDGVIGIYDFRGDIIRAYQKHGFTFHSEVVIWKDPLIAATRTHALGLAHKQIVEDSARCRTGIPDYLVVMSKPGTNPEPVGHKPSGFTRWVGAPEDEPKAEKKSDPGRNKYSHYVWQRYASPVWFDIDPSDTLQKESAREDDDSKHICLARGSLVLTRDGYIPIESVNAGMDVLTHRGRWRRVLATLCNGISPVIATRGQGVPNLITTPDHSLWCRQGRGLKAKAEAMGSSPQWVPAQSTLGSYVNLKLPPIEDSDLTTENWWLVGRWLGDGHVGVDRVGHGRRPFVLSCSHQEASGLMDRLSSNVGAVQVLTATQFVLRDLRPEIVAVLQRCGRGASGKRLPFEAICLSPEKSEALLSGYLSADGHYVKEHDRWMASSVSRALLLGMALVAQRARGVVASIYAGRGPRVATIQGRSVNCKQDWIFSFRNSDGYKKSGWLQDDGAWKKVRRLETHSPAEVWDIQVEEDQSFTAEGCIVHNCPLQLTVIRRAIELWSNPGDVVFDPFSGNRELWICGCR